MGLFDFFKKKKNEKQNGQTDSGNEQSIDDFAKDVARSADFFVSNTSARFEGLDYSLKSLEVIDKVLEEVSDFYAEMNDQEKQRLISSVGSYIFEVARRNFGGKYFWYDKLNQPIFVTGQPDFEVSILAFDKVKGRLENGKEDNIPFYFAGYVERVQSKQSGMIV
jgi:hypothetical protein